MLDDRYDWIMSPQARRRMQRNLSSVEREDLAKEIARNLGFDITRGDAVRIVFATLNQEV